MSRQRPNNSRRLDTEVSRLQLEVDELRAEAEESQTCIVHLTRKAEAADMLRKENELIKGQFMEVREHFQDVAAELKVLRERERKRVGTKGSSRRPDTPDNKEKRCSSCTKLNFEKTQLHKQNSELLHRNKLLDKSCRQLETQTRSYQKEFLESLGIPESQLCRSVSTGGLGQNFGCSESKKTKECECNHLHQFLRKTIENLRAEYLGKSGDINDLKHKLQQEMMKCQKLESEVEKLRDERRRAIEGFKTHEVQITYLTNEIKELQNYCSSKLQQDLEGRIKSLKADNEELATEIKKTTSDYESRIGSLEKELRMERQRADVLLTEGINERDTVEKRWKKIWEEHNTKLSNQLTSLKANYEHPLKTSHSREITLQKELTELEERYQQSKDSWELYRTSLFEQLNEWKSRFAEKCEAVEEVRQTKMEVDIILVKRTKDLEICQDMLNKGVDERSRLQKKVEAVQTKLKELLTPEDMEEEGMADCLEPVIITLDHPALLSKSKSWFTLRDFKKLKSKMVAEQKEQEQKEKSTPLPSPTATAPTTAPSTAPTTAMSTSRQSKKSKRKPQRPSTTY